MNKLLPLLAFSILLLVPVGTQNALAGPPINQFSLGFISAIPNPPMQGQATFFEISIINVGSGPSIPTTVQLYREADLIDEIPLPSFPVATSVQVQLSDSTTPLQGLIKYTVTADPASFDPQTGTGNNVAFQFFNVVGIDPEVTVIKTVTGGGPLDANSFDLFVDDGVLTQVQNGVPELVSPGLITFSESISGPLTIQYLPTYSGDCVEDNLNDDKRNQIHDLVAKANALQDAINNNPGDPLNDDREQSINDLLSKARALLLALSATVTINEGESLTCEITNDFLPVVSPIILAVGGTLLEINSSSLILAGTQMTASWLIPVLVSAVGIGLVLVRRK